MRNELDRVLGWKARWAFSVGCAWAALQMRTVQALTSRERGGESLRLFVFGGITAATALVAYGLTHYPGLRSESGTWVAVTAFLLLMAIYAAGALALSRGSTMDLAKARRYGIAGGLAIGLLWLIVLTPLGPLKAWVALPLAAALLGPAGIAALAGRASHDSKAGARAALWSGLVAGLLTFIVWVTETYLDDGRPYDPGLIRDFHRSESPDLTTYAVSDNLGSGLVLLLIIPTVALALGTLIARLTANPARTTNQAAPEQR